MKKNFCKNTYFLIIFFLIISCTDFTSEKRFNEDYIVITGMIYSNKPITMENPIFVGTTADINNLDIESLAVKSAVVYILDLKNNIKHYLSFDHNMPDSALIQEQLKIGFYDTLEEFIPVSGNSYRIVVKINTDSVYAETTIPKDFITEPNEKFIDNENTEIPLLEYHQIDNYPIQLKLNNCDELPILMEYYCLEEWYNAYWISENDLKETPKSPNHYENTLNGAPRLKSQLSTYSPTIINDEYIIKLASKMSDYTFYGKHRIRVAIVDENYYNYKFKSTGYFHGGVINGVGYFGSATRYTLYTNIVND